MSVDWIGRALRRLRPQLDDDEGLVATVLGVEAEGRRRLVVVLTDRRLLIAGLRDHTPVALDPDRAHGAFDPVGGLLTFREGDRAVVLRDVPVRAAEQLLGLLSARHAGRPVPDERPPTVRVVGGCGHRRPGSRPAG